MVYCLCFTVMMGSDVCDVSALVCEAKGWQSQALQRRHSCPFARNVMGTLGCFFANDTVVKGILPCLEVHLVSLNLHMLLALSSNELCCNDDIPHSMYHIPISCRGCPALVRSVGECQASCLQYGVLTAKHTCPAGSWVAGKVLIVFEIPGSQ